MANFTITNLFILSSLVLLFLVASGAAAQQNGACVGRVEHMYQLGDSIADTGNLIRVNPANNAARFPYGESAYFRSASGRCSDGLLIVDNLAMALRLPLLNPYLEPTASFQQGANFAVAGSTALDTSFFAARGIPVPRANRPLSAQLNWFTTHLNRVCVGNPACIRRRLQASLVMMGEIGGNDYNNAFFNGKSTQEIRTYVPSVVGAISAAVREVIRLGATRVVVPGNFPIGCFPIYLTSFPNRGAYDDMGCLSRLNAFAQYHNSYLQGALSSLRREFPQVAIVYADYYNAFQSVLRRSQYLGINPTTALSACCGRGGRYNYAMGRENQCGSPGVPVCPNPSNHISWDGIHLTQNAYRHMSEIIIPDILTRTQC